MSDKTEKAELTFDTLVKPTREQIKQLWAATKKPTIRLVAKIANKRGWKISAKTVDRWKHENWQEPPPRGGKSAAEKKLVRQTKEARKAMEALAATTPMKVNPAVQAAVDAAVNASTYQFSTLESLMGKSKAELKELAEKVLMAATIIVGENVCDKGAALSLIPKEVGHFVDSSGTAIKQIPSGDETVPNGNGDGAKVIEGTLTASTPPNPISDNIRAFMKRASANAGGA